MQERKLCTYISTLRHIKRKTTIAKKEIPIKIDFEVKL